MRRDMDVKNMINKNEKRSKVMSSLVTAMLIISTLSAFFIAFVPVTSADPATKLVFSSGAAQTLTAGVGSSAIVIQRQDASSDPVSAGAPAITVDLSTTSAGDAFYSDSGCTIVITSIEIAANASDTAGFYYNDSVVGSPTLTGAFAGLTSATTGFTINSPSATKLVFSSGAAQTLTAGVGSSAIVIQRQDASSDPVSAGAPSITITLSTNSAGGHFYSNSGYTNLITSIGISAGASNTAGFYYKDSVVGSPTLTGAFAGLTSATTTFTVNAATVAALAIQTQPTYTVAGVVIIPPIEIVAKDAFNNGVSGVSIVATKLNGTGVLSGTTTRVTNSSGVASFNNLSINLVGTDKTLRFTAGAVGVNSTVFTISNTSVASLTIQLQPSNTVAGAVISPSIQIKAVDAYNNVISGLSIVATLHNGTGVLSGTKTRTTNSTGIATFNDLSINLVGSHKTLRFTAGAVSVNSSNFTITASSGGGGGGGGGSNDAPTANTGGPYTGVVGTPIYFNGSKSTAISGRTISSYSWSFGDGTTSTGVKPSHTYTIAGSYTVRLTVTDNIGSTNTASTTATISAIAPPAPSVNVSSYTLQEIENDYGVTLAQPFYASDTNGDGIVDIFTDPNNILTAVSFVNISGHASFLISTNNDDIPEFFWDTANNTMTPVTHTPAPLTTPFIDTTAKTVTIEITVNKTGWIYLDITDQYPLDEYPQYTFTIKTGNRIISSDMIWRKNGKIYILDDPATNYELIYGYTILSPAFYPQSGIAFTLSKPTITITYQQQVSVLVALLDAKNIMYQFTTTDNKTFIFTPTIDLTDGTHTLSLTVQDAQGNQLTSTSTYTINLPKKQPTIIDNTWIIIAIIAIIIIIIVILVLLRIYLFI